MAIQKFEMPPIPKSMPGVLTNQAAGAIIIAADTGRCLWQLRGPDGDAPNVYGQFGGGIEPGETREAAVQRELAEEAGYEGDIFIRALKPNVAPSFTYHNHVAVVPNEFEPKLNAESNGHVWCDLDHWPRPLHPGVQELFKDMASLAILRDTHFRREYLAQYCKRYGTTKMAEFVQENK